jgi:hypothetical protein
MGSEHTLIQDSFEEQLEDQVADDHTIEPEAPALLFVALSVAAFSGGDSHHTMQFTGSLAGQPVLILVDSDSSHSSALL